MGLTIIGLDWRWPEYVALIRYDLSTPGIWFYDYPNCVWRFRPTGDWHRMQVAAHPDHTADPLYAPLRGTYAWNIAAEAPRGLVPGRVYNVEVKLSVYTMCQSPPQPEPTGIVQRKQTPPPIPIPVPPPPPPPIKVPPDEPPQTGKKKGPDRVGVGGDVGGGGGPWIFRQDDPPRRKSPQIAPVPPVDPGAHSAPVEPEPPKVHGAEPGDIPGGKAAPVEPRLPFGASPTPGEPYSPEPHVGRKEGESSNPNPSQPSTTRVDVLMNFDLYYVDDPSSAGAPTHVRAPMFVGDTAGYAPSPTATPEPLDPDIYHRYTYPPKLPDSTPYDEGSYGTHPSHDVLPGVTEVGSNKSSRPPKLAGVVDIYGGAAPKAKAMAQLVPGTLLAKWQAALNSDEFEAVLDAKPESVPYGGKVSVVGAVRHTSNSPRDVIVALLAYVGEAYVLAYDEFTVAANAIFYLRGLYNAIPADNDTNITWILVVADAVSKEALCVKNAVTMVRRGELRDPVVGLPQTGISGAPAAYYRDDASAFGTVLSGLSPVRIYAGPDRAAHVILSGDGDTNLAVFPVGGKGPAGVVVKLATGISYNTTGHITSYTGEYDLYNKTLLVDTIPVAPHGHYVGATGIALYDETHVFVESNAPALLDLYVGGSPISGSISADGAAISGRVYLGNTKIFLFQVDQNGQIINWSGIEMITDSYGGFSGSSVSGRVRIYAENMYGSPDFSGLLLEAEL